MLQNYMADSNYNNAKKKKKNCKDFEKKNLNENHDFYLKRNPLLLADVFENFTKMCLQSFS